MSAERINYNVVKEVKTKLEDGEFLCFQEIYPIIDGKRYPEDTSFRFIRAEADGRLKAQRGQAQAKVDDFEKILNEMKKINVKSIVIV